MEVAHGQQESESSTHTSLGLAYCHIRLSTWTLNKELCENIEVFETQCYRRSMRISYTEHVTNNEVLRRVGQDRKLMGQVKSRKLKYVPA